jgi:hypothetical protein
MSALSITAINRLEQETKEQIYLNLIPQELKTTLSLPEDLIDENGRPLYDLRCQSGATDVSLSLWHKYGFLDPSLYVHLSDTITGQIHVLLYVVNDPNTTRFDVDKMPDGTPTHFGTNTRNLEAEEAALEAGLAPGQIRSGLRVLKYSIRSFETFVSSTGRSIYFVEPLYYHNAIIFERYGFRYQSGYRRMVSIDHEFRSDGSLHEQLDGSTPFRQPGFDRSIRGRSWAIHDGIMGVPYSAVTMYKRIGTTYDVDTFVDGSW